MSGAYLEITLDIKPFNRDTAAKIYREYRGPFLTTITGAKSKDLLIRDADVQVLHGFDTVDHAEKYLQSDLFNNDVVKALKPLLEKAPEIRIYSSV